jgi:DNA mismatch repair protein MutS2
MAEVDSRFENASVDFDPDTLAPTYRLRFGAAGSSSATAVAARMGLPQRVLDRANALLAREDRRLDRVLAELAASRAALERERDEAVRLREESAAARDAYRERLLRLQERRDRLFGEMRRDLDGAFRSAHAEVAAVIRDLQRHGRSARAAAHARDRLLALEREAEAAQRAQPPLAPALRPDAPPEPEAPAEAIDWRRIAPGARVRVAGGASGRLLALPDKSGRAAVQIANAKLLVPADRLLAVREERPAAREPRVQVEAPPVAAGRVDLRGLRVDEALARLEKALDDAARGGHEKLEIVHGVGSGALQTAVREHLRRLPFVARSEPGPLTAGGEGVTIAWLD